MMKGYNYLTLSIISEVFGTAMLKLSNGFTLLFPSLGVAAGYGLAFYFLSLCLRSLPLSIAYAIWSGAGTALTALIGYFFWNEIFNLLKVAAILIIISGIFILNMDSSKDSEEKTSVQNY